MAVAEPTQSIEAQRRWEGSLDELRGLVSERAITGETMLLNMGPHHPSTHGVLRLLLELDGEQIVTCLPDIGFLHTGIEKSIEDKSYEKAVPLTDRMDYLSPMSNNMAFPPRWRSCLIWMCRSAGRSSASFAWSWRAAPVTWSGWARMRLTWAP